MIRRGYAEGGFGQVHWRAAGDGPPLILLHQSPLSGAMFEPALEQLARAGLRAIALDTPGYGMSDPPPVPVSIEAYSEALGPVLDSLGLERAHVLGHHTGAAIATAFAARQPTRVDRLVLNGVPLLSAEELAHFRTLRLEPLEPRADGSHLLQAWHQRIAATPGWSNLAAMHKHTVEMLRVNHSYWWAFQAAFGYGLTRDLALIRAPTLILTNTGEDLYAASKRAAELRPDFAFAALVGGTHDIVDEQPAAWAGYVARFVLA